MQQITENVYVETGFRGCNTSFVVTRAGVVVIDTPMVPGEAKKWRDEAAGHGSVRYVIDTEPHLDHAGGNCWFDAPVLSHEGTRQALSAVKIEEFIEMLQRNDPGSLPLSADFHFQLPEITFSQSLTLYLGQHTFQLINLPGHTASETAVYVPEEKVVFTGDNLNLKIPIFIKSRPFAWLESLKYLRELDADHYVPGHGDVCGKDCIQPMYDAVREWIDLVKSSHAQGLSLEQTIDRVALEKNPQNDPWLANVIRLSINDLFNLLKA